VSRRRWIAASSLAFALAAGGVPAALAAGDPPDSPPDWVAGRPTTGSPTTEPTTPDPAGSWVTLVTGDRVYLEGANQVALEAAAGREHIGFAQYVRDDHQYVVPNDAVRMVAAGELDERLFDVTGLIDARYDDAHTEALPTIVTYDRGSQGAATMRAAQGADVERSLPGLAAAAVSVEKEDSAEFWSDVTTRVKSGGRTAADGVKRLWLDGKRQVSLDTSVPQIGAPSAWDAGYRGAGVDVAVLDTGIDETHPDLAGRIVEAQNFTDAPDTSDNLGHGTHVASTIVGSGAASGGRYRGVAPEASLYIGKVCPDRGCPESAILAGMQWAAPRADVVNLSLGGPDAPGIDPLEEAVNTLTEQTGALFVIAAGNEGRDTGVGSPATADAALAVGAVTKDDGFADFSNRGPRVDGAIKPEIAAPGVGIVAALSKDSAYPVHESGYTQLSGTSMATPHVAGAAALLAQQHPDWDADELKAVLMSSAEPLADLGLYSQGAGRVDLADAVSQTVVPDVNSLALGSQPWPADDDAPVTERVSYRNTGTDEVTIDLTAPATGPEGAEVPGGMFTVTPSSLTIPPGASAEAVFTADTSVASATGTFTGAVVATPAGGAPVRVPFAISKAHETRDLTIALTDRDGKPASDYLVNVVGIDDAVYYAPYSSSGTVTVKVRADRRYFVFSTVNTPSDGSSTLLVQQGVSPEAGGSTLRFDARSGTPVDITGPDGEASTKFASVGFDRDLPSGYRIVHRATSDDFGKLYTADLGGVVPADAGTMDSEVRAFLATPGIDGTEVDAQKEYVFSWFVEDRFLTDFSRTVKRSQLAEVTHRFHAQQPEGETAYLASFGMPAQSPEYATALAYSVRSSVPRRATVYYLTDSTVWMHRVNQYGAAGVTAQLYEREFHAYRPGKRYTEEWAEGPLGPRLNYYGYVQRQGNNMLFHIPIWGDQSGHAGWSDLDPSTWVGRFSQDGETLVELPAYFYDAGGPVPSDQHSYTLAYGAERPGYSNSTKVSAEWTFLSSETPADEATHIPLATFSFKPNLDLTNAAEGGEAFFVPVSLDRQGDVSPRVRQASVEVSYDDGVTWRKAALLPTGTDSWVIPLRHPERGTVSFKAAASFLDGSSVDYEVLRAYTLRE
jgi:subtilisin family serine protease